jgi:transposase
MNSMHCVGLDIHKKSISSCVRQADGTIVQESTIAATHQALDRWMEQLNHRGKTNHAVCYSECP